MTCRARILPIVCLFTCSSIACGPPSATDGETDTGAETGTDSEEDPADTATADCTPAIAVEIEVEDNQDLPVVAASPCLVTGVEQDADEPGRWDFELECQKPIDVTIITDPPLAAAPFEEGEMLSGIVGSTTDSTGSYEIFEATDSNGRLRLALQDYLGPAATMLDGPTAAGNPFDFEWSVADECVTLAVDCGGPVNQMTLDASAGAEPVSLTPDLRHAVLAGAEAGESYELWVGNSWTGDCSGDSTKALRYLVVAL